VKADLFYKTNYTSDRNCKTVTIFLHGFLESSEIWHALINDFKPKSYFLIDLPGHGKSAQLSNKNDYAIDNIAKLLHDFLKDKINFSEVKINLVGHSLGGYVSLAFAAQFPNLTESVVLVNSTALADSIEKKENRLRAAKLVLENRDIFVREMLKNLFNPNYLEQMRWAYEKLLLLAKPCQAQTIANYLMSMRNRLEKTEVFKHTKVHWVIGKKDALIPFADYETQLEKSTGESLILEEGGHLSFFESPEKLNAFLNRIL
jgi:pimeloyl-ACP methyl ester carboxylesterase